jgi:carbon monoxide dehydrogenase subunit G
VIRTDRRFPMAAPRDAVWTALSRPDRFAETWPWLRSFDGRELRQGVTWRCEVQPPVPYRVRFAVHLREVAAGERIEADVDGDVTGWARVLLVAADGKAAGGDGSASGSDGDGDGDGIELWLRSELAPGNGLLRGVLRVMPPLARFGHDWILDTGARQFRERRLA